VRAATVVKTILGVEHTVVEDMEITSWGAVVVRVGPAVRSRRR
jgi:hypothetical protein